MTERGDGGAPGNGGWPGQGQGQSPTPPPGPWQAPQQQGPPQGQPGWDGRYPTQQFGAVAPQQPWGAPQQQPPRPEGPAQPAGAWNPATGPAPWAVQPSRRSRRKPVLIGAAAVLVLLLVGGGLFLLLRGADITYDGRTVAEPQQVLDDAEGKFASYAQSRNGATSDQSSCWFERTTADGSDVRDAVLCGPVLFVDGDPSAAYLPFPITPSTGSGDVTFTVADEPGDPEPQALPDPDLLVSPDGSTPPDGSGDVEVPQPPQAASDYSADGPVDGVDLTAPDGPATLSGAAAKVQVTGVAEADRVGRGDDALRPADGEVFRVFSYAITSGEGYANTAPTLSYVVEGRDPVAVDPGLVSPGATVEGLLSAPEDAAVDLVVVDDGVTQTLSLVDGTPGTDNLQVTVRANRASAAPGTQSLPGNISRDGLSADANYTLDVSAARIGWYTATDITVTPSAPNRGFLVIQDFLTADNASFIAGKPPSSLYTLTLPDGTVVPGQNLSTDPALVATAFDVPADFTTGTLTFGGTGTLNDGSVLTFAETRTFPVSIPAG